VKHSYYLAEFSTFKIYLDDETIVPAYEALTSFLPTLNHFVEKNDNIFAEVNDSHNNSVRDEEVPSLELHEEDSEKG